MKITEDKFLRKIRDIRGSNWLIELKEVIKDITEDFKNEDGTPLLQNGKIDSSFIPALKGSNYQLLSGSQNPIQNGKELVEAYQTAKSLQKIAPAVYSETVNMEVQGTILVEDVPITITSVDLWTATFTLPLSAIANTNIQVEDYLYFCFDIQSNGECKVIDLYIDTITATEVSGEAYPSSNFMSEYISNNSPLIRTGTILSNDSDPYSGYITEEGKVTLQEYYLSFPSDRLVLLDKYEVVWLPSIGSSSPYRIRLSSADILDKEDGSLLLMPGNYNIKTKLRDSFSEEQTIIVPSGYYEFTEEFVLDTPHINIVSLTGNSDINIIGLNGIRVAADNVYIKGINTQNRIILESNLSSLVMENCIGGSYSYTNDSIITGSTLVISGTFINCKGGYRSFAPLQLTGILGSLTLSGTFIDCELVSGFIATTLSGSFIRCKVSNDSFSGSVISGYFENCSGSYGVFNGDILSGKFIRCTSTITGRCFNGLCSGTFIECEVQQGQAFEAANTSDIVAGYFRGCVSRVGEGFRGGTAAGTYIDCQASEAGFGSVAATGIFYRCTAGSFSFGKNFSGTAYNCIAGASSFGANASAPAGTLTGKLYYCRMTSGAFRTVTSGGITRYCVDGSNVANNQG